ncbi:GNAT family N-acetyltransferase [Terribacillus sp. AE2B 122]|jgi:ribosomal protein S18 acetylase RimI-like enzyme|uniref:GNAT family N-acetyltransferase n=1 Tax=Terribacillus sp. AE2B 122 TaxID=1331902 RepID=UPI00144040DC|nr:GNAT family N-acetyltransferase [Terribacillus sp. AE2B 122]VVM33031.1 acetyltransferase2C GNAT family [Terribacillus sp. AE2B 122]
MVETTAHFQLAYFSNQVDIEQIEAASVDELRKLLEHAESVMGKNSSIHTRVTVCTEDKNYDTLHSLLSDYRYDLFARKHLYRKQLAEKQPLSSNYRWEAIGMGETDEKRFLEIWKSCMEQSANRASARSIENQLDDVKALLGEKWQTSCRIIFQDNIPIAMTIPHLEPGRNKEGRIYYIGTVPAARGKGLGKIVHAASLMMLKEMGAVIYEGSTHADNLPMQRVFEKNGCKVIREIATYYKGL